MLDQSKRVWRLSQLPQRDQGKENPMSIEAIFGLQFLLSLFVFALIARWYVSSWLSNFSLHAALSVLVLPHAFRHIGMSFLVPNLVGDTVPPDFAAAAAYGDLASAIFALVAIFLLRAGSIVAIPFVWIFNVVGIVDLVNALRRVEAIPELGMTWYIPTFIVPILLVSHVMIFIRLIRGMGGVRSENRQDARRPKATEVTVSHSSA